ncbi:hypothetical protein D6825_01970 [Candidatus Woesearchaeota archaeon]|nr:MAG: hypothetical protein D6825_01970 [Candidatus Woesearchaeota archaeon]
MLNEWFNLSLGLLAIWALLYHLRPTLRKEMLLMSLFTMPLGLTEPIFVPEYWHPPSLFNLATRTGFDLESLIFSFAIGGIASVLYEALVGAKHRRIKETRENYLHYLSIAVPFITFTALYLKSESNPIYLVIISALIGTLATLLCRPDLSKNIIAGGLAFLTLYFVTFLIATLIYPTFISQAWNLKAISGTLILGIPLEELLFALSIGMLWSGIYEQATQYRTE